MGGSENGRPSPENFDDARSEMKVLLVVHQFFPEHRTGTEVLTLELARGLRRRGHAVEILAGDPAPTEVESTPLRRTRDEFDGFTIHRFHYGLRDSRDRFALHTSAPARTALVREVIAALQPDIVHVKHFLGLSSRLLPEVAATNTPVVFTATDFWAVCPRHTLFRTFDNQVCEGPGNGLYCIRCCISRRMPTWVARAYHTLAGTPFGVLLGARGRKINSLRNRPARVARDVNAADIVISATKFLADILIRHGIEPGKTRVVPYGVDIGAVGPRRAVPQRFTPAEPLRLGFIGSITEMKAPHVPLEALANLGEKVRAVSLDLYGKIDEGDRYCRLVREKADRCGGTVTLCGTFPHERIGEILSGVHLLVMPSIWYESTPLVLCAALAARVPVLVSRLGGMTEVIEEGVNGLSFPAGDSAGLGNVIRRLLDEPGVVAQLHRMIRPRNRSTADYTEDIEAIYREVVQKRP
jgi:glycosyltransferase involved in cell wall biosynthesis